MNMVMDLGNTRLKYAVYEDRRCVYTGIGKEDMMRSLSLMTENSGDVRVLCAVSGRWDEALFEWIRSRAGVFMVASREMSLPVRIDYRTPETLGMDRIAVVVGARSIYPRTNVMVVDMGTAITYDYLTEDGRYSGGNISPGPAMRFRALHEYTAKLPLLEPCAEFGAVGDTTSSAIINGVMLGMVFEIQKYVDDFKKNNPEGRIILTGGYKSYVEHKIEGVIYVEHLNLLGLNEILIFNTLK